MVKNHYPKSWHGSSSILHVLLWVALRDYIEENRHLIDQVESDVRMGWANIILDLDVADLMEDKFPQDALILPSITPANRQKILDYRAQQSAKDSLFDDVSSWLVGFKEPPSQPESLFDWIGLSEILGWAGYQQIELGISGWLLDSSILKLVNEEALEIVGNFSLGLFFQDKQEHASFIEKYQSSLDLRLINDLQILMVERDLDGMFDGESRIKIHFIPQKIENVHGIDDAVIGRKRDEDSIHVATIERIKLIRMLYPFFERYASQGYGFKLGDLLVSQLDESRKDVKVEALHPYWLVRLNQLARCIGEYPYRPESWEEYATKLIEIRYIAIETLEKLQIGLIKFLGSSSGVNISKKYLSGKEWDESKSDLSKLPRLPKLAVDPWGFTSESNASTSQTSSEALNLLNISSSGGTNYSKFAPVAMLEREYDLYLNYQRKYLKSLSNTFDQAWHVIVLKSATGKLKKSDPANQEFEMKAQEKGIYARYDHLSTRNYWEAVLNLEKYQASFRLLLSPFTNSQELELLEAREERIVKDTWAYWYHFANKPEQTYANARKKVIKNLEWKKFELDRRIQITLDKLNKDVEEGALVSVIESNILWKNDSALWIHINIEDPLKYYDEISRIFLKLQEEFGTRDVKALEDYILEKFYKYVVILPTVKDKLVDLICFVPHFFDAFYEQNKPFEESPFTYLPTALTQSQIDALGLQKWDLEEIQFANDLASGLHAIRIVVSQFSEFMNLPDDDLEDAGFNQLQEYLNEKSGELGKIWQSVLDSGTKLLDTINGLSDAEMELRPHLVEGVQLFMQINSEIAHENGTIKINLLETKDFIDKYKEITQIGEVIRWLWITDILNV